MLLLTTPSSKYSKELVRWRVYSEDPTIRSACWEDSSLFEKFTKFYADKCKNLEQDLCMITGERDVVCNTHPKGVISASFGAKIISANDSSGFTYRGRFTEARQAFSVGYNSSQKAHNALRWLCANSGIYVGGRIFVCWNPKGKAIPDIPFLASLPSEDENDFVNYKKELSSKLNGYKKGLDDIDDVVIASFDAATTGRLSITYYNELKASDFLERIENWYETCCILDRLNKIKSPPLRSIINCAFGTQKNQFIEVDDKVLKEHVQRLLPSISEGKNIPFDIIYALSTRASNPLAYSASNRELLISTTCAVIRKYKNDKLKKEEWTLALDKSNSDRSYLFGRLLAVAEQVEKITYSKDEKRETNAIRMQAVYSQRPMYSWRIIEEKLNPYFSQLSLGSKYFFKNLIGEIVDMLPGTDDPELRKKLEDSYLLGYYHQRNDLIKKKETKNEEEFINE